VLPLDH